MKVIIYYLTIPEKYECASRHIDGVDLIIDAFSENSLRKIQGVVIESNGIPRYLYAYTNKAEIAKDFEYIHDMSVFTKITRKMDNSEFKAFSDTMKHANLEYYEVEGYAPDKAFHILMTQLEMSLIEPLITDIEILLSDNAQYPYTIFKDKYVMALDLLLYTLYYQLNGPDSMYYDYNWSYGCTPEGAAKDSVKLEMNYTKLFLEIFSPILKKG